jgi:hypothetical protein
VESQVCTYAKAQGMLVYKFTSPARTAVPDRLFINKRGVVWFAEFKAPGKKPTVPQYREQARLMAQKVLVYVIDDVTEGKFIVDMML